MSTSLRICPSLIVATLLFCGSAVIAQEEVDSSSPAAADGHGHAHAEVAHEFAREDITYRRPESFLAWTFRAMGLFGLLIPVAGLFCFVLTLVVVIRGQGPFAFAALALLVPIPFLLGLFGTVQGLILSLQVIATSTVSPKPSELSDGIATALFTPLLGLVFMTPSYLVATLGSIFRSFAKPAVKS